MSSYPQRVDGATSIRARLERLVNIAKTKKRALVLTHDNPDPDSVASAVGLAFLLEELADLRVLVAYGGIVGRAENRALVRVLKLPLIPVARVVFEEHDLICMVDTQPGQGNHSLPPRYFPDVVIDHHPQRPESGRVTLAEVGGDYGATSTIVTELVRQSGLKVPPEIATALLYGIKADTRDLGRETTQVDVDAYLWLFPSADKAALAQVEHPKLPLEYFKLYRLALDRARVYDVAVVCDLGAIYTPDMVAEVAERFLFLEDMKWSLAFAEYGDQLWFSLRTSDRRMNAGRLIREVIEGKGGSAGGHGSMAGGRIPLREIGQSGRNDLKEELLRHFLREFGVRSRRPRKIA